MVREIDARCVALTLTRLGVWVLGRHVALSKLLVGEMLVSELLVCWLLGS